MLLFTADQRVAAVSAGSGFVLGKPEAALMGMRCRDALSCPQCAGEACPLKQALAGSGAVGFLPGEGRHGPLAVSASPIQGIDGQMALLQMRVPESDQVSMGAGLRPVLDSLREVLKSDLAALAFYDEADREIRWQVTSGSVSSRVESIRLRPGQGFAGRIVLTDLPLRTFRFPDDLTIDPGSYPIFLAEELQAALGVPVRGKGRILGVLMVGNRRPRHYSEAEQDVLTSAADSISLAAEMIALHGEAIRRERAKLAQEVHDGLSQNLFGLKLLLTDVHEHLHSDSPQVVERGLSEIRRVLEGTLGEVRRLIADFRGSAQMRVGLLGALSDCLASFFRLSGLPVELAVRLAPGEEVLCADPEAVLRIVQEALMNTHRHAAAAKVWVEVDRTEAGFCITIIDDGRGFDTEATPVEGHYGLSIMRERAEAFKGTLAVHSAPGSGTTIALHIPV